MTNALDAASIYMHFCMPSIKNKMNEINRNVRQKVVAYLNMQQQIFSKF
jgi:hypothetical protein